jgi:hypothetical protein
MGTNVIRRDKAGMELKAGFDASSYGRRWARTIHDPVIC